MAIALTIPDARRESGVGRSKIYEAIAAGELPARKLGRRTLILADDLRAWLEHLPKVTPPEPSRRARIGRKAE
jgi:excisionase family DNA binding protein